MLPLLRRHAAGIAIALLLGALIVSPRWWLLATEPPEGARVPVAPYGAGNMGTDEALQLPSVRQAYDGKLPLRAAQFVNHRDDAIQAGAGWQQATGILGHVTGGPSGALALVTSIAAAGGLLALYALAYHLTGSRPGAAAALPLAVFGVEVLNHADGFLPLRHWYVLEPLLRVDQQQEFHVWTRFLSPVMVLAPFFVVALALPRAAETGRRGWMAAATVALALLVYSYVYYWTATALAAAAWAGWLMWRREWTAVRRLTLIGAGAALLAVPELAIVVAKSLSTTADAQARVGLDDPGIVWSEKVAIAQRVLFTLPFVYVLRERPLRHGLYAGLLLSPLLLTGIDGLMPQPWHYRTQVWGVFALPGVIAGAAIWARRLPPATARAGALALVAGAVLAGAYAVALQARAIDNADAAYAVSDDERAALDWIERNVDGDETVASPSITTGLLVAAMSPAAGYMLGPYNPIGSDDELIDRYLRLHVAYGYGEADTFARLDPRNLFPFDVHGPKGLSPEASFEEHAAYYVFHWEITHPETIERRLPGWHERFRALQGESSVLDAWPVEYLYCGPRERLWPVERAPSGIYVREAFRRGDVAVYRLTDASDAGGVPFAGCAAP